MGSITDKRLREALSALGELLAARGAGPAHLIVIGGSGLLAIGAIDRVTRDVDVLALECDGVLVSAEPLPEAVLEAAAIVGRDFGLGSAWLNSGPTGLLDVGELPDGFVARLSEHQFGQELRVSFAGREDQIAFKLYAAVDRYEARDAADLRALSPSPDELRSAARWVRTQHAPGPIDEALDRLLARFGVEDEGRSA